jgi:hypothetical protein
MFTIAFSDPTVEGILIFFFIIFQAFKIIKDADLCLN